jgi:hypothetical protein
MSWVLVRWWLWVSVSLFVSKPRAHERITARETWWKRPWLLRSPRRLLLAPACWRRPVIIRKTCDEINYAILKIMAKQEQHINGDRVYVRPHACWTQSRSVYGKEQALVVSIFTCFSAFTESAAPIPQLSGLHGPSFVMMACTLTRVMAQNRFRTGLWCFEDQKCVKFHVFSDCNNSHRWNIIVTSASPLNRFSAFGSTSDAKRSIHNVPRRNCACGMMQSPPMTRWSRWACIWRLGASLGRQTWDHAKKSD